MLNVSESKPVKALEKFLRGILLWDTTVSLYLVLKILWRKIITVDLDQRAAAVSFSFMLAIFPGIIFLFTLIPYIPIDNLDEQIMLYLKNIFPRRIYTTAASTIEDIVSQKRANVLSFGFIFTVYAATNGMMALMRSFNMVLHEREKRGFFKARLIGFNLTILLIFLLISAIVILIIGNLFIKFLIEKGLLDENLIFYFIQFLRYASIFFIFVMGIGGIYSWGPAVERRFPLISVGAVVAAVLCIIATNIFSFYIVNFDSYNRLYGSIGTLIGLMVWIYLISLIIILGFEINNSVRDALELKDEE